MAEIKNRFFIIQKLSFNKNGFDVISEYNSFVLFIDVI